MTIRSAIKNRVVAKPAAFGISAVNLSQIRGGVLLDIQDCTHVFRTSIPALSCSGKELARDDRRQEGVYLIG